MTDFTTVTACGEFCIGCSKKKEGICPGCIETDGWVKGNPQAEYFWKKNGFIETGAENTTKDYTVTIAQRKI